MGYTAHHLPGATLIPAWISNHMRNEECGGITYPFPNFNGGTVEVWEWVSNFIPHFIMDVITFSSLKNKPDSKGTQINMD